MQVSDWRLAVAHRVGVCTWFTFRSYLLHDCPERFLHLCMLCFYLLWMAPVEGENTCFFQDFDRLGNNLSIEWILCWPIYIYHRWKTTPDWLSTVPASTVWQPYQFPVCREPCTAAVRCGESYRWPPSATDSDSGAAVSLTPIFIPAWASL